jgi:hypothetical protein
MRHDPCHLTALRLLLRLFCPIPVRQAVDVTDSNATAPENGRRFLPISVLNFYGGLTYVL